MSKLSKFTKHSTEQFFSRTEDISRKEVEKAIKNKNCVQFFKRETASRSMAYVILNENKVVKAVLNRTNGKIITILPWRDDYCVTLTVFYKEGKYLVTIFPDCFYETGVYSTLTHITKIEDNGDEVLVSHNDHYFKNLFDLALERHYNHENKKRTEQEKENS